MGLNGLASYTELKVYDARLRKPNSYIKRISLYSKNVI